LTELQNQRGALDVELAQKDMSVQNLREKIQQKYHVNLDDVRSECITITYADEGPAKVQTLTPEEMAASGAATDWNAVTQQVEALQMRLDEIGPVNLVAIEEYEETEQRYQFLTKQHDDLVSAKAHCWKSSAESMSRRGRCSSRRLKKSATISATCSSRSSAAARRT
jgi:chromosome segregation protein